MRRARTEYEDYLQIYEIVTGKRPIPDDYFPAHFTEDQKSRYVRDFLSEPPDYYKRNLDRAEAELRRLENNRP